MDRPAPLLATADAHLAEEVQRLAASVGTSPVVTADAGGLLRRWNGPPLVLVGADLVEQAATLRPPRRAGVVLVSSGPLPPGLLRPALDLGVGEVVELPSGSGWLATALGDLEEATRGGPVVGVLGGAGGAGATTFAAALGQLAATQGPVLVVDADPLGPGLDRVLGVEQGEGVGWEVLTTSRGRLSARDLREGVPRRGPLGVLTWRAAQPPRLPDDEQLAEVVEAARRGHDLVVLDLARSRGRAGLLARCDLVVVLVPATVVGVASTVRACAALDDPGRAGLVLVGREADEEAVAHATGLPVLARMTRQRGLDEAVDLGLGPVRHHRGQLGRAAAAVLTRTSLLGRAA
jgi:secretion/DNA translocation related CpaE-like protein